MLQFNFIKNLTLLRVTLDFKSSKDKIINVKSGKNGINVLSSPLDTKAIDFSKNSSRLLKEHAANKKVKS